MSTKGRIPDRQITKAMFFLGTIFVLISVACGGGVRTATTATPILPEPASGRAEATATPLPPTVTLAAVRPEPTAETPRAEAPAPPPTLVPTAASPAAAPPVQPLRAWAVADDGAVFVLDAAYSVVELAPGSLAPLARSGPLFGAAGDAPAYLSVEGTHLFVGSAAVTQTLVLDRGALRPVATLPRAGPMAVDPGRRVFVVAEWAVWAYDLADLGRPPAKVAVDPAYDPRLGYGAVPKDLVADPAARQLYVVFYDQFGSPPHNPDSYRIYDLDTLAQKARFGEQLGSLTRPAVAGRAGLIVATHFAKSGFLGSKLAIFDRQGQEIKSYGPLDGVPATDADAGWIYLLRQRGLWVLRGSDLALQSVLPFTESPPADLALSPDGATLYLFGNGWLTALRTAEVQALGIPPVSPFPAAWMYAAEDEFVQPRFYPSPGMDEDGVAFVQVGGYGETYRTTDGGRSWRFLPALTYPDFRYVQRLSLSPDFASDHTLTAYPAGAEPLLRSTDGGRTWAAWTPRIAFVSDRNGDREIYTMNQEGTDMRRVTDDPAADENPAWSPGWTRLAFQSDRNGNWDIFTVKSGCDPRQPAGCDLRQLTTDPADDVLPAWSPDGRRIAFVSTRDGNPEIYVMDSDGRNQRRLTFNPTGDWRPAWLPDSRHLVFTSDRTGNNDIYRLAVPPPDAAPPAAELELTPVVTGPADDRDPAVSAENTLLFLSDRDGFMRAYTLDLRYGYAKPYAFAETDQPEAHPSWVDVEGGYAILVAAERDGVSNVYRVTASGYTPLSPTSDFDGHPAWGPVWWRPEAAASREGLARLGR